MKSYNDLTPRQQERAVAESLRRLLVAVTDGGLRFNDVANGNALQSKIDGVLDGYPESEPENIRKTILLYCRLELTAIARMTALDAVYVEGDTVISVEDL